MRYVEALLLVPNREEVEDTTASGRFGYCYLVYLMSVVRFEEEFNMPVSKSFKLWPHRQGLKTELSKRFIAVLGDSDPVRWWLGTCDALYKKNMRRFFSSDESKKKVLPNIMQESIKDLVDWCAGSKVKIVEGFFDRRISEKEFTKIETSGNKQKSVTEKRKVTELIKPKIQLENWLSGKLILKIKDINNKIEKSYNRSDFECKMDVIESGVKRTINVRACDNPEELLEICRRRVERGSTLVARPNTLISNVKGRIRMQALSIQYNGKLPQKGTKAEKLTPENWSKAVQDLEEEIKNMEKELESVIQTLDDQATF